MENSLPYSLLIEAYCPQLAFGDWQLVISVNRRKNRIAVEQWHSSESDRGEILPADATLHIKTGIRAFRRHMPILAKALERCAIAGKSVEEVVESVFEVLADVYQRAIDPEQVSSVDCLSLEGNFAAFLQHRKNAALAALSAVKH